MTDNAYVPYQPNTELQFDAPSTLQFLFNGAFAERMISDERLREEATALMARRLGAQDRTMINVGVFTVVMLLVAAMLVVVFGEFRFGSDKSYHATFADASRLKAGQDVRIAGVPVGAVKDVTLNDDNTVDVAFTLNERYQLYTSSKALVRYENLVGDRYLEIASGPGDLVKLPGGTITNTAPALDLDALLGGLKPVFKGLDGRKINEVSNAIIEYAAGPGRCAVADAVVDQRLHPGPGRARPADRRLITHLNTVLGTVDEKGAEFDATVDKLQKVITGLAQGRDPIAGAIGPLASATNDLTETLEKSRRPLQGVLENVRPLAQRMDERKGDINKVYRAARGELPAAQRARRVRLVLQHLLLLDSHEDQRPAGSDILIPFGGPADSVEGEVL